MASSSSSSPLEDLETQLEMFVENVRQIRIIVADFQPQGQTVLNQKMYLTFFTIDYYNFLEFSFVIHFCLLLYTVKMPSLAYKKLIN